VPGDSSQVDPPEQRNTSDLEDPVDRQRLARLVKAQQVPTAGAISASRSKRLYLTLVLITAVVILFLSTFVFFFTLPKSQSVPPRASSVVPSLAGNVNQRVTVGPIKHDMIFIPGGTFKMGRDDGQPQERPGHRVAVEGFFLDNTEVTNAEYTEFVRDTKYQAPSHWSGREPVSGQEQWPVVNVSSDDARAFASWRSKRDGVTYRLPTEEEWEYAARNGDKEDLYPWGNAWMEGLAVVNAATPAPVGSYPAGKNRWGVLDLIGNVWEWTSSKASLYDKAGKLPGVTTEWLVARGGGYSSNPNNRQIPVSSTYRDWFEPTLRHPSFGFRLVRSAQ